MRCACVGAAFLPAAGAAHLAPPAGTHACRARCRGPFTSLPGASWHHPNFAWLAVAHQVVAVNVPCMLMCRLGSCTARRSDQLGALQLNANRVQPAEVEWNVIFALMPPFLGAVCHHAESLATTTIKLLPASCMWGLC